LKIINRIWHSQELWIPRSVQFSCMKLRIISHLNEKVSHLKLLFNEPSNFNKPNNFLTILQTIQELNKLYCIAREIQTEIAFKCKAKQKTTSSTSSSSTPFKSEKCLICNWRISHLEPQQFTILSVDLFHPQLVLIHSTELEYLWESFFQFNYSSCSNIIQTANDDNTENFFIHSSIFYFLK